MGPPEYDAFFAYQQRMKQAVCLTLTDTHTLASSAKVPFSIRCLPCTIPAMQLP